MLTILTKPTGIHPFKKEWLNYYFQKVIRRERGPSAVLNSLLRGLKDINEPFVLNPTNKNEIVGTVIVPSGIEATKEAIVLKEQNKISKLIVGPNITIAPIDENNLLLNKNIDNIIVPSLWVKDFFLSFDRNLEKKIIIWGAGVIINQNLKKENKSQILLFKKNTDKLLFEKIKNYLEKNNIKYKLIEYGKFSKSEYIRELKKSIGMIYLQEIESQGIALLESWSYNVPTLIWSPSKYKFKNYNITVQGNINAPYFNNNLGELFGDYNEFEYKINIFLNNINNYKPYDYVKNEWSDRASTLRLLSLIKI